MLGPSNGKKMFSQQISCIIFASKLCVFFLVYLKYIVSKIQGNIFTTIIVTFLGGYFILKLLHNGHNHDFLRIFTWNMSKTPDEMPNIFTIVGGGGAFILVK